MSTAKQPVIAARAAALAGQHAHLDPQQKTDQAGLEQLLALAAMQTMGAVPGQAAMLLWLQPARMAVALLEREPALRGDVMQVAAAAAAAAAACQWQALATAAGMTTARSPSSSTTMITASPRLLLQQTPAAHSA
jgi:hypothetical protein